MKRTSSAFIFFTSAVIGQSTFASVVLDARSVALSNTGIAQPRGIESVRHNPALIHHLPKTVDTFAFSWSIGVNAFDEDDFINDVDDGEEAIDELQEKADNGTIQSGDSEPVIQSLRAMSGDVVQLGLDDTMVFGFPRDSDEKYSFALSLGANADIGINFQLDESDVQTVRDAESTGQFDESSLVSQLRASGVMIIEAGLTGARDTKIAQLPNPVTLGVTLKYQDIRVIDYVESIGNFDDLEDIDDDQYRKDHTGINLDLGAHTKLSHNLSAGIVIRNLIPKSYSGPVGDDFDSKPQLAAGLTHHSGWLSTSLDLDLTKREGFSVLPDRQDAKLSVEIHAGSWAQFRFGYRTDISGDYDDSISAGFGFSYGSNFNIDLGVFQAGGESAGVGLQFGFAF